MTFPGNMTGLVGEGRRKRLFGHTWRRGMRTMVRRLGNRSVPGSRWDICHSMLPEPIAGDDFARYVESLAEAFPGSRSPQRISSFVVTVPCCSGG